jgi:hypothetical protein
MNPKIILAFAGGVLAAGSLAFLLTSNRDGNAKNAEARAQTPAQVLDVASVEPEKPVPPPLPPPWPKVAKKAVATSRPVATPPPVSSPASAAPSKTEPSPSQAGSPQAPVLVAKSEPPAARVEENTPRQPAKPVRVPAKVTIPEGTSITVRINSTLSTEKSQDGERFTGTLETPIVVDEMVIAEKGARVEGRVAESTPSGRVKGKAELALVLTSLATSDGQVVVIKTDNFVRQGESSTKGDAAKIGIGAAAGAALGAIFGGGKGAAIGAASGGAAGTGVVLATRGKPAVIAVESRIPFRLASAVTVTEKID